MFEQPNNACTQSTSVPFYPKYFSYGENIKKLYNTQQFVTLKVLKVE